MSFTIIAVILALFVDEALKQTLVREITHDALELQAVLLRSSPSRRTTQIKAVALAFPFAWRFISAETFAYTDLQLPAFPLLLLGMVAFAATFIVRWRRIRRLLVIMKSARVMLSHAAIIGHHWVLKRCE
jgi:hypothetical protein